MQQFLIDANIFVAAIKNPDKKSRTLDLILELISNDGIKLVGNDLLLLEFEKYSEKFRSETASHLLKQLKGKMTIIELDVNSRSELYEQIRRSSIVYWQHINLLGEFDFSDEKLKNAIHFSLPKILELKVT